MLEWRVGTSFVDAIATLTGMQEQERESPFTVILKPLRMTWLQTCTKLESHQWAVKAARLAAGNQFWRPRYSWMRA